MSDCQYYDCQNTDACFRCDDGRLYKPPKNKKANISKKKENVSKLADNSWEGLEGEVAKSLNKIPTFFEAERQIRSGGFWWAPGDIRDNIIFAECKERKGSEIVSRGTKSFTIEKDWLDKGVEEARSSGNKPFFLPWRFKGDDRIWVNTTWDWIAELVCMVKSMFIENQKQKILIQAYRKKIKELGGNAEDIT